MLSQLGLLLLAGSAALADLGPVPAGTLRVVVLRHGQAYTNLDTLPSPAPADPDALTPLGREQVAGIIPALTTIRPGVLLTSPAGRARQTADQIGKALGLEPRVEPKVRPMETDKGETLEDVGRRALALVEELRPAHPGQTVLLVCHSEVVAGIVRGAEVNSAPLLKAGGLSGPPAPPIASTSSAMAALRVPNASLTVIDARGPGDLALRLFGFVPEASPSPRAR